VEGRREKIGEEGWRLRKLLLDKGELPWGEAEEEEDGIGLLAAIMRGLDVPREKRGLPLGLLMDGEAWARGVEGEELPPPPPPPALMERGRGALSAGFEGLSLYNSAFIISSNFSRDS